MAFQDMINGHQHCWDLPLEGIWSYHHGLSIYFKIWSMAMQQELMKIGDTYHLQGRCKGKSPQNMALGGTVPRFRILKFPLTCWGDKEPIKNGGTEDAQTFWQSKMEKHVPANREMPHYYSRFDQRKAVADMWKQTAESNLEKTQHLAFYNTLPSILWFAPFRNTAECFGWLTIGGLGLKVEP